MSNKKIPSNESSEDVVITDLSKLGEWGKEIPAAPTMRNYFAKYHPGYLTFVDRFEDIWEALAANELGLSPEQAEAIGCKLVEAKLEATNDDE